MKRHLEKLLSRIKKSVNSGSKPGPKSGGDYFKRAASWADDYYSSAIQSRNRYKLAFLVAMVVAALLCMALMMLSPLVRTQMIVVHEGQEGYTWITTAKPGSKTRSSWAKTQSELAHYVRVRASYDPVLYSHQAREVRLLSVPAVTSQYEAEQSSQRKSSPINVLGAKGYRKVHIQSILQLDSLSRNKDGEKHHVNLAQVNYVVEDHFFDSNETLKVPYTALVSWVYTGVPKKPSEMMDNWDGFKVARFSSEPVNIGKS